jgi:hypothetical protein
MGQNPSGASTNGALQRKHAKANGEGEQATRLSTLSLAVKETTTEARRLVVDSGTHTRVSRYWEDLSSPFEDRVAKALAIGEPEKHRHGYVDLLPRRRHDRPVRL